MEGKVKILKTGHKDGTKENTDPAAAVQDAEDAFVHQALTNDVILSELLKFFDVKSLLQFSLVSKNWRSAARSILRSHRRCLASIPGIYPCDELLRLNEVIRASADCPYSGVAVRTCRPLRKCDRVPFQGDYDYQYYSSESEAERSSMRDVQGSPGYDSEDDSGSSSSSDQSYRPNKHENELSSSCEEDIDEDESGSDEEDPDEGPSLTLGPITTRRGHDCVDVDILREYSAILSLSIRQLELHWDADIPCPAQALIVHILKERRDTLLELKITRFPMTIPEVGKFLGLQEERWLKSLRVLDLACSMPNINNSAKYELILATPALEKQMGMNRLPDLEFFLEHGLVHKIRHYDFFYPSNIHENMLRGAENEILLKFAETRPKLTKFIFTGFLASTQTSIKLKFMQKFLRVLLEAVSDSLEEFQLDQNHLLLLVAPILVQPFSRLKKLNLGLSKHMDSQLGYPSLPRLNWTQWFPHLTTVEVLMSPHSDDDELASKLIAFHKRCKTSYSCPTVKTLIVIQRFNSIGCWIQSMVALNHFKKLFPNVKNFVLEGCSRLDRVLKFLWYMWQDLETITFSLVKVCAIQHNLDHVFCGVSRSRASQLREQDLTESVLGGFQPDEPCLLSLPKLKKLRVEIVHRQRCDSASVKTLSNSSSFFLTEVTAKLALARLPDLHVEILREDCKGNIPCGYKLEHLKPFVTLLDSKGNKVM